METFFKGAIQASGMKMGELMMPFRIMLVGGKFGPDVFQIVSLLGKEEVIARVDKALIAFSAE
ncbi:Glutamate--tRNA ligase [compost metagenome]